MAKVLNKVQMETLMRQKHKEGMRVVDIAKELGVKRWVVANYLQKIGYTSRAAYTYSEEELKYIIEQRAKGIYMGQTQDIADYLGRPYIGVRKKIHELIQEGRTPRYQENMKLINKKHSKRHESERIDS